jgi:hypothetical protein
MSCAEIDDTPTGAPTPPARTVTVPFDRYEVTVRLSSDGTFLDVESVAVRSDFRSFQQRLQASGCHDVADLYGDETDNG